jgi:hypothetical protein
MTKNGWQPKTLPATSLYFDTNNPQLYAETTARAPREKALDVAQSVFARRFAMKACLASAVLLVALLAPSASAQYIYVANAGEDTVSKIDINTNTEVARYATWFTVGSANYFTQPHGSGSGPAPSRLLQDSAGNLYVLNRWFGNTHRPVLLKIAPTGGTPGVTTSNGPGIRPMLDVGTTNNEIDAGDTKDARILWGQPIGPVGGLGRALCMDTSGVLWVGMYSTMQYYRVDSTTGQVLAPLGGISTAPHRPYGCQVDTQGRLWSVDAANTLLEINTTTNLPKPILNHGPNPGPPPTNFGTSYSLSLFNGCGSVPSKIYLSERSVTKTYIAYDPQTSSFSNAPLSVPQFISLAVGVDLNGNIVSGKNSGGRVIKTDPVGNVLWDTTVGLGGPTVAAADLHGIIIDEHNDVWAVHLQEDRVVKYSGVNGRWLATVQVGRLPYTYGNPPPPSCPCAEVLEPRISCEKLSNGTATYPWSFTFTNHSPFATPATAINISSTQVTNISPSTFVFTNPVPVNGQATVSGTFSVANPVPGSQVCLDIRLNAGEGWCCPIQHVCFVLPECPGCAKVQAAFKCQQGKPMLQLSITNQGPTVANAVTVYSTTPGVTVTPATTTQTFPQNTPVQIPLTVTGAAPGQTISLTVNLNGPIDPKTGLNDWCCTSTVTVMYPKTFCAVTLDGWTFNDLNRNGLRDSGEDGLPGWTVTVTDGRGTPRTTTSDATGMYHFENVEQGTYRLSVQAPRGWGATVPETGVHTVTVAGQSDRTFDFGFVKTQP